MKGKFVHWGHSLCLALFVSVFISLTPAKASESSSLKELVAQSKQAFSNGRYQYVVELLSLLELEYGGDQSFDYYLGTALLETKKYGDAVFLLSRAVAVNSDFAGARFELARAEYLSNNHEAARKHFEIVLNNNPPDKVEEISLNYMRLIENKTASYTPVHKPKIGLRFGSDSNVSNGHENEIFDDLFDNTGLDIDDKNRETESNYFSLLLSDSYIRPISDELKWSIFGNAFVRKNQDAEFVDLNVLSVATGIQWNKNKNSFAANLAFVNAEIAGEAPDTLSGTNTAGDYTDLTKKITLLDLSYSYAPTKTDSFSVSLKNSLIRHDRLLEIKDVDRLDVHFSYRTTLADDWLVKFNGFIGEDEPDGSYQLYKADRKGVEASVLHPLSNKILLSSKIKYENVDFQNGIPFLTIADGFVDEFGVFREDKKLLAEISLTWFRALNWSHGMKFIYVDNESNSVFYDYDKTVIEFSVDYQF